MILDIFLGVSTLIFGYMAPDLWTLLKRDLTNNPKKREELSKITKKNAEKMISRINLVRHSPKSIFNKINNIHHKSFPNKICQVGAIGSNILKKQGQQGRQSSQRQSPNKSGSKKSSDDNGGDGGGEPPRPLLAILLDQSALAESFCISKKSVQNIYSATPWLLPKAIQIPGSRGPRWTLESVQQWLDTRPPHSPKTPASKKVGRPRLAFAGKGGAA